jgi:predicted  nucleic acid-binding Zn-ribbon protein
LSGGVWVSGYTAPATYNIESVVTLPTSTNITRSGYILLRWHEGSATGAVVTVIPPGSTNNRAYCSEWGYTSAAYDTAVAAKQAIIDQLNGEKTTLTNEKTALQGQVTTLTNEKTALQEQVTTLTNEKGSLQTQLGNKIQELADKTKAYNDLWSDYQALLGASVEDSEEWAILKAGYDIQIAGLEADITQLNGQINTKDGQISALNGTITGLSTQIEGLNTAIGQKNARILELEDYIAAHENDYDIGYGYGYGDGYDDGFGNYVKEYGFVAWKILQSDEAIAGPLTTYDVYDNVKVEYGTQIQAVTLPEEKRIVYSKQYVYTFVGWSLTPQRGETPNTPVALPKADATNVVYYAQYKRTVRTYDIKWVIPIITEGQLDYNIPPEELEITTLAYGTIITTTPVAPGVLHGNVNYIFDGWSSTPYGVKIQPGVINGGRTFYARYIPKQTV